MIKYEWEITSLNGRNVDNEFSLFTKCIEYSKTIFIRITVILETKLLNVNRKC